MQQKINLKGLRGCVVSFTYTSNCYGCGFYYLLKEMIIKCNCVLMSQIYQALFIFGNSFIFYRKNNVPLTSKMILHEDRKREASHMNCLMEYQQEYEAKFYYFSKAQNKSKYYRYISTTYIFEITSLHQIDFGCHISFSRISFHQKIIFCMLQCN